MSEKTLLSNRSKTKRGRHAAQPRYSKLEVVAMTATIGVLVCTTLAVIADLDPSLTFDASVLAGFAANWALAMACLIWAMRRRPFSLVQVHWIFFATFLVIAPLSQYLHGYLCWNYPEDGYMPESRFRQASGYVFLWGLAFCAVTVIGAGKAKTVNDDFYSLFHSSLPRISKSTANAAFLLAFATTAIVIVVISPEKLITGTGRSLIHGTTAFLIFNRSIRIIPVFAFLIIMVRCIQQKRLSAPLVIAFFFVLICNFPAAVPRFNTAAIYGGIALLALPLFMNRRGIAPLLLIVLLLVAFPALDVFRREGLVVDAFFWKLATSILTIPSGFCSGHFDAYSMLMRTLEYTEVAGFSNGWQLLTVLLFFIPRSIWPSKGIGSGATVASFQGQDFTNLASPLPAEGFINFGIIGLLGFAVAIALLCRSLDAWFFEGEGGGRLIYPFLCLLFFFMLRGDLLSSWAYTMGYVVTFTVVYAILVLCIGRIGRTLRSRAAVRRGDDHQ